MKTKTKPLTLEELKQRAVFCVENGINILLVGSPGVGKSQWVEELSNSLNMECFVSHPAMGMPTDIMGLPFKHETEKGPVADFLPYGMMRKVFSSTIENPLLVFFDDFGQAPATMQAAMMQLVESRCIDGKPIPDSVKFILATNSVADGAGVSKVIEPLKGRCAIFDFLPTAYDWIEWGFHSKRIHTPILFYINSFPGMLNQPSVNREIVNVPTPRNWERVSKFIEAGFDDITSISACVGFEVAVHFRAFLDNLKDFKMFVSEVEADPQGARIFGDLSKLYAASYILAAACTPANIEVFVEYLSRYEKRELTKFFLVAASQLNPKNRETQTYIKYKISHKI